MADINNALLIEFDALSGISNLSTQDRSWLTNDEIVILKSNASTNITELVSVEKKNEFNSYVSIYPQTEIEPTKILTESETKPLQGEINAPKLLAEPITVQLAGTLVSSAEGEFAPQDIEASGLLNLPTFRSELETKPLQGEINAPKLLAEPITVQLAGTLVSSAEGEFAPQDIEASGLLNLPTFRGESETKPLQGEINAPKLLAEPITVQLAGTLVSSAKGEFAPQDIEASGLLNLPTFRSDARFQNIDGRGFSVVVLDTGIDLDHAFFGPDANGNGIADRIVYQYDFSGATSAAGDSDADASDRDGHGSNVTSIIGGNGSVAGFSNYRGIAPGVNLIILKVFADDGSGNFGDIERALKWVNLNATAYNIVSVNMSLGDSGNYSTSQQRYGIADEMLALANQNVAIVSAAGNAFASFNTQGVSYPAADPNSFAIGAVFDANIGGVSYGSGANAYTTEADRITPFSQRHGSLTTVFAPGGGITGANQNGGLATYHGTSQATPFVAGAIALAQQLAVQQLGRRLTVLELNNLLRTTGTTINDGDDENDNVTNTGLNFQRLDVVSLGNAILNLAPPSPTTASIGLVSSSQTEGNSGTTAYTFTVSLDRTSNQAVTLNYSTNDGTATLANGDYVDNDGALFFNAGVTSQTITVLVNGDTGVETDETFSVSLNSALNATINPNSGQSTGIILNDDSPVASIGSVSSSQTEGNSGTKAYTFTVNLDRTSNQAVTLNYSTNDGTAILANGDYVGNDGSLFFDAGVTSQTITVLVNGDTAVETDENFSVSLNSATNATISTNNGQSTGIILNDDSPVASIGSVSSSQTEGNSGTKAYTFTVNLDRTSNQAVTLNYSTNDGTATLANGDYVGNDGSLFFNAGVTSQTITVLVNGDTAVETDENFSVSLNSPTNATINTNSGQSTGIILNDDTPPAGLAVTINGATQNYALLSYAGAINDVYSVSSINGNELSIAGNAWKRIAIPTYTLTSKSVLEFDFKSTRQGEIQGIGFDDDNILSSGRVFNLYGTQGQGILNFRNYATNTGSGTEAAPWASYRINVASFLRSFTNRDLTTRMASIIFSTDDDLLPNPAPANQSLASSKFRNIRLYEDPSLLSDALTLGSTNGASFNSIDLAPSNLPFALDDSSAIII